MLRSRRRSLRARSTLAAALLVCATPAAAAGPDAVKVGCAQAYETAQRLREAKKLRDAREQLLLCARPECPAILRRDCTPWLGEIEATLPQIVIVVRGEGGRAPPEARVFVDGAMTGQRVDATPMPLDPGEHVLVFETASGARVEERVTLREGERERRVEITLAAPAEAAPPPEGPRGSREVDRAEPRPTDRPVPPLVYVLGAAGIVATGIGGYFQLTGMSQRSDLSACQPGCPTSRVDDARRNMWIGNVGLTIGVLSLAGAIVLYLTRPEAGAGAVGAR